MTAPPLTDWRQQLLHAGLLVPLGADGLYARSGDFESIVTGLEHLVQQANPDPVPVLRFPPLIPLPVLERTGYVRSFPQLFGVVRGFAGSDRDHAELLERLDGSAEWTNQLDDHALALCSAACHPLYPTCTGDLPADGKRFDVLGICYRHEPSLDPARMQIFRQLEMVRLGDSAQVRTHRDEWVERAEELLSSLGLDVTVEVANDPFFGRAGRILATSQREAAAKLELLCPIGDPGHQVAVSSGNDHGDHFGHEFAIRTAAGEPAHSACIGFGLERITLALLWRHGLDISVWPEAVRRQLWP